MTTELIILCFFWKYHVSQIEDLEAKADTQDEGSYGGDETREEGVEGEGANLIIKFTY